jgi:hypothetical protein
VGTWQDRVLTSAWGIDGHLRYDWYVHSKGHSPLTEEDRRVVSYTIKVAFSGLEFDGEPSRITDVSTVLTSGSGKACL